MKYLGENFLVSLYETLVWCIFCWVHLISLSCAIRSTMKGSPKYYDITMEKVCKTLALFSSMLSRNVFEHLVAMVTEQYSIGHVTLPLCVTSSASQVLQP